MRGILLVAVAAMAPALTGCSYSPATGWRWDDPPRDRVELPEEIRPGSSFYAGPMIDVGDIGACDIDVNGGSVCDPR
jgi:hypothetical protein